MDAGDDAFGSYRLLQPLDYCEVGEAYVAKRSGAGGFEKPVALWRVHTARGRDERFVAAVISEAKQAAFLSHASIAHVLDLGLSRGNCFVATELATGATLDTLLRRPRPTPWSAAAYIVKEVAKALGYAHRRRDPSGALLRLVHGRLSPRRIVLRDDGGGGIKITGFGTSRAWTGRDLPRVPEADRGEPIDGRADVFALGKILEACLARNDAPRALWRAVGDATDPYQEYRCTAWELEERLTAVLHRHHPCATAQGLLGLRGPSPPHTMGRL